MRTYSPKASEITRKWFVIDAEDLVLGRLSTEAARILRGKHKATFAPHLDTGDHVIVVNCDKVVVTANKAEQKLVYRHSGYPGGLKTTKFGDAHAAKPEETVRRAIRGMLPKNRLGRPDAHEAPGLRRARPPPRRAEAGAARPRRRPAPRVGDLMPQPLVQSTGRRKQAVARVRLRPNEADGDGVITVNGRALEEYFPSKTHIMILTEPLRVTETATIYNIDCTMHGGGQNGQAGALRLGIARALIELDPERRDVLKKAGFLTRDAREKESKKYGLKKARKAPQYSKR